MAVFLIGEMKRENAREREFDKEEQARREYRRSCDDEAAERQPNNSPIRYSAFMAVFLIGEMKSENSREREFDKEEQARREYRRSCDDEATERQPNNSPIR